MFLGEDLMTQGREYSDDTAKMIDEEVFRILHEQEARAHEMLTKHRRALDLVAEALLERETIDGGDVARIVHESLGEDATDASTAAADDAPAGVEIELALTAVGLSGPIRARGSSRGGGLRRRLPTDRLPTSGR